MDFDIDEELERVVAATGVAHASVWVFDATLQAFRCVAASREANELTGVYVLEMARWAEELGWRLPTPVSEAMCIPVADAGDGSEVQIVLARKSGDSGKIDVRSVAAMGERYAAWRTERQRARAARRGTQGPEVILALAQKRAGALEAFRTLLEAEAVAVFQVEPSGRMLRCTDTAGFPAERLKGATVALGEGILGDVVAHRRVARVSDTSVDPRFLRQVDRALPFRARSVVCAPVLREGFAVGAVHLVNRVVPRGELPVFDADDERWVMLAALALAAGGRRP